MENRKKEEFVEKRHLTESTDSEQDFSNDIDSSRKKGNSNNKPTIIIENGVQNSNGNHSTTKEGKILIPIGKQEMSPFEVAHQLGTMNLQSKQPSKNIQTDTAPTAFFNKDLQTECLLHKVQGRDTMQGIALKYGVEVSDLKKVNKIWSNNDLFARKDLIIPTSLENYLAYRSKHDSSNRTAVAPKGLDRREEMISKFVDIAHCDREMATHYLEEKKWNFAKALGFYFAEQENKTFVKPNGTTAPIVSLDDLEVWTDDDSRHKKLKEFEEMTIHALSGPANVGRLNKRVQEKFAKDDEAMFDL